MADKLSGVVTAYLADKGFGFVRFDADRADGFFHGRVWFRDIGREQPEPGDRVICELGATRDGREQIVSIEREGALSQKAREVELCYLQRQRERQNTP